MYNTQKPLYQFARNNDSKNTNNRNIKQEILDSLEIKTLNSDFKKNEIYLKMAIKNFYT